MAKLHSIEEKLDTVVQILTSSNRRSCSPGATNATHEVRYIRKDMFFNQFPMHYIVHKPLDHNDIMVYELAGRMQQITSEREAR